MSKGYKLLLIIAIAAFSSASHSAFAIEPLTENQKALQETAMAYYYKGPWLQYDTNLLNGFLSPEETTSQDRNYFVCSSYTHAIYYQTFTIRIPSSTQKVAAYANTYYGQPGHEDIILLYKGDALHNKLSTSQQRNDFKAELLSNLKVGDSITYYFDPDKTTLGSPNTGHSVFVYDFEYDENQNKTNAIILHSTSNYYYTTTKAPEGVSYNNSLNSNTGISEGTVQITTLDNVLSWAARARNDGRSEPASYFTVLRPIGASDTTYNFSDCSEDALMTNEITCTTKTVGYAMTSATKSRLKYPGIQIEKTVDKHDNNNVSLGDTLTYTIKITNNSQTAYNNVPVTETIPSEVTVLNAGGGTHSGSELKWSIPKIEPGQQYVIEFSVQVINDVSNIGKEITLAGKVDYISSGTVKNKISRTLAPSQKEKIKQTYEDLKTTYQGAELIDEIYKAVLNQDFGFKSLKLGARYDIGNSAEAVSMVEACDTYWAGSNPNDALIFRNLGNRINHLQINTNNPLHQGILDNYYYGVFFFYDKNNACSVTGHHGAKFNNHHYADSDTRPQIASFNNYIYPETFETGDVLLFQNSNDSVTNEEGYYAYIYIDDNFYGINYDKDGSALNTFYANNNHDRVTTNNLPTLYKRDFYAIIRPAMLLTPESGEEPAVPEDPEIPVVPNTGALINTNQGGNPYMNILAILIGTTFFLITLSQRKWRKVNFNKKWK